MRFFSLIYFRDHLVEFKLCVILCVMKTVSIYEVQHHFSRVLSHVSAGETVEVCRRKIPVARLVPIQSKTIELPDFEARLKRRFGNRVTTNSKEILHELREDRL